MPRAFIILLDSFGIGASDDAVQYSDKGADTLRHIAEETLRFRNSPLQMPNLTRLGLNAAAKLSSGSFIPGLSTDVSITGAYGFAAEKSLGEDTPSGHWEIAG